MNRIDQLALASLFIVIGILMIASAQFTHLRILDEQYEQLELRVEALERRVFMHGEY